MKDLLEKLNVENEENPIIVNSSRDSVRNLLNKLETKFINKKDVSHYLSVDPSTVRRWKRNGQIPLPLIVKLRELFPNETKEVTNMSSFLSLQKSSQKVKIPEINCNIGYVIGYISGDGHLRNPLKNRQWEAIIESWTDKNILKTINKILQENFEKGL